MRAAKVYRVVAHYDGRPDVVRDFLTKRTRDKYADMFRTGREGLWVSGGPEDDDHLIGYVEKADHVETLDSAPVEFVEVR